MSAPPPPPPPPHGEAPKTTAGGGSGLPPGKYDVFIIPDHSAGAGFLYLPSLRTNTNSFIAGFASALLAVVLGQTLAPAFQTWWASFQGMGNAGMALLVIAVGLGAWSLGRLTSDSSGRGAGSWSGGGFYSGGPSMPTGGFSGAGPSAHGSPPPNAGPTPGAHSPPPSGGPNPGTNNPEGSYERPPEPPPKTQQTKPKPQAEPSKKTWEKAREEVRKKEEERKAKEAEDKRRAEEDRRRAEAAQRLKELREKEARERAQREVERARREQEAREKAAKEQEARDKEVRETQAKERKEKELREAREKELRERLARDREERRKRVEEAERKRKQEEAEKKRREEEAERLRREEIAERIRREEAAEKKRREEATEKKRREEAAEKKRREEEEVLLARKSSAYAFSGVGEKLNPWPNGKPPSVAPSAAPSAARSSVSTPPPSAKTHPPPTASNVGDDSDAYSYRPYDQPKRPARRTSNSDMSESSWAPSQSTTRTTPPPSVRTGYATKDPDKIVIKGVYCFMNQYAKTPASQLISGMGTVTDGLILRITTEGLFIDDDVRGVAQREWDVKAWTLKLVEVWCPVHFLVVAIDANSPLSPNGSKTHKASSSASNASTSFFAKMVGGRARLRDAERGPHKVMTDDVADEYFTDMLRSCKDSCRLGDCASKFAASNLPNTSATPHDDASSVTSGSAQDTNSTVQTGDWKARGIHLLRATIRDQEGKRYLFVFGEEEGWKLALGLQRLRRGTQVRGLAVSALSGIETKTTLDMLGWG